MRPEPVPEGSARSPQMAQMTSGPFDLREGGIQKPSSTETPTSSAPPGWKPDRPCMNLETQLRGLLEAGVPERNIHADIDVSGVAGVATGNAWRSVDAKLERGDALVVAAIDRVVHHSVILEFDVPSYRTGAAQQRGQDKEVNRQE